MNEMYFSLCLIILSGLLLGALCKRMKLPALLGMMAAGLLLGPYCLNWIDAQILDLSELLRRVALLIILIRAGLNLKLADLKKAGRPALLLCFVPATFEIAGFLIFAPLLLHFSLAESAVLGCVMAAVSPAVVVPGMLEVMDHHYGQNRAIPQMILAGASADDIYVLVLFSVFSQVAAQGHFDPAVLWRIPTSVGFGILGGILCGYLLSLLFEKTKSGCGLSAQILILLAAGLGFYGLEDLLSGPVAFSGLIATMTAAMTLAARRPEDSAEIAGGFDQLWKAGEIFLFVLIGAAVNIPAAWNSLWINLLLIVLCLLIRSAGVLLCVSHTRLNWKEKLFCIVAYLPKATVQAAIGSIPLSMGLPGGQAILSCAVTAILFTAPAGATLIHFLYPKLLQQSDAAEDRTS